MARHAEMTVPPTPPARDVARATRHDRAAAGAAAQPAGQAGRAGRPRLHRHLVGGGRRRRRVHAARPRCGVGAATAPRYRHRAGLHAVAGVPGAVRRHAGRRGARPLRHRHRLVEQRHRRALERRPVRRAVQEGPRRRALPARRARAARRSPSSTTRSRSRASGSGSAPSSRRRSSSPRCGEGCCASPVGRPTERSSTGCRPTTCRPSPRSCNEAAGGEEREIVARIFVCPSENAEVVRAAAKFAVAAYLNVPVYAEFHRWLGRSEQLQPMWDAWAAGDRKAAVAAIPDEVVDELVVHGSAEHLPAPIQQYFDNGVTTSSLAILPLDPEVGVLGRRAAARTVRRLTALDTLMPRNGRAGVDLAAPTIGGRVLVTLMSAVEPGSDLGDVTEATAPGRLVETELHRHRGLGSSVSCSGVGGWSIGHAPIMKQGVSQRSGGGALSRAWRSSGRTPEVAAARGSRLDVVDRCAWRRASTTNSLRSEQGDDRARSCRGSRAAGRRAPRGCRPRGRRAAPPHTSQRRATSGGGRSGCSRARSPSRAGAASTRAGDLLVGHLEVDHAVDVVALQEELGLADVAREPVDDEAVVPVVRSPAGRGPRTRRARRRPGGRRPWCGAPGRRSWCGAARSSGRCRRR